jgi:hypothetical protein
MTFKYYISLKANVNAIINSGLCLAKDDSIATTDTDCVINKD